MKINDIIAIGLCIMFIFLGFGGCVYLVEKGEAKVKLEVKADTNNVEGITIRERSISEMADEISANIEQLIKARDLLLTNSVSQQIANVSERQLTVYGHGKLTNIVIDPSYQGTIQVGDSPAFSLQWRTIDRPAHIDQSDTNHTVIVFTTNSESLLTFTIQSQAKWWSTKTIFQRTNN